VASTDARQAYGAAATAPPAPLPEQGEAPEAEIACLERHRRVHNQEMVLRAAHRAQRAPSPPRTVPNARSAGTTTACGATCVPHGAPRTAPRVARQDDARWQQQRQALHDTPAPAPAARRWIAVLVLTVKCTRHCLGPPLFEAGPTVTAPLVRAA